MNGSSMSTSNGKVDRKESQLYDPVIGKILIASNTHSHTLIHYTPYTQPTRTFLASDLFCFFVPFFSHLTFDRHTAFKCHCNLCQKFQLTVKPFHRLSHCLDSLQRSSPTSSTLPRFESASFPSTTLSNLLAQPLGTLLCYQGVPSFALLKTIHS